MRGIAGRFGLFIFASFAGYQLAFAGDACEATRQALHASSGQLLNLGTGSLVAGFAARLPRPRSLHVAYVVPSSGNLTGAFIVKVRHQLPKDASARSSEGFPSGDYIRLQRPGHASACTNQWRAPYDQSIKLEHYIDEHYYGIKYQSMDEFHAEIGYRERQYSVAGVKFSRNICRNTYDPETRADFLYSDNPHIASYAETATRRTATLAKQAGFISDAFADEAPRYRDKLNTAIIPYRRINASSDNCASFEIDIPEKAGQTDIEIIDADEGLGFHHSWQIDWQQN